MMSARRWTLTLFLSALAAGPASAQWEVEADPFAYMVRGFSAHLARKVDDGATQESRQRSLVGLGPRAGYRLEFGRRLYVTPWVSVRYLSIARDVAIAGRHFNQGRVAVLPTAHVGRRL